MWGYTVGMFSLRSRRHRHTTGEVVLIFDIGSGSVGAALALISRSHKPILLATERTEIAFQDAVHAKRLQPLMLRALSQATLSLLAESIRRQGLSARHLKVTGALFVLAAPWCSYRTKTLTLSQKEPLSITEEVISELVRYDSGEEAKTSKSISVPERQLPQANTRIEHLLLSAHLNGYETEKPTGKDARAASFSFFESRAPSASLRAIEDTVAHFIHPRRIRFHSYTLSALSVLRETFPDSKDFLFLDIGGEITETVIVRNNVLRESFSFPLGRNHLIRALAEGMHSSPSTATGILALAQEENLHPEKGKDITSLLRSFGDSWMTGLAQTVALFSDSSLFLPPTTYLSVDSDCAEFFADFLHSGKDGEITALGDGMSVVSVLRSESFRPLLTMSSSESVADSFLTLETVYANQLLRRDALFA